MTEYFIRYQREPLAEIGRMTGPNGTIAAQQLAEGQAILAIREQDYALGLLDLPVEPVRDDLWRQIKAHRAAVIDGGAPTPFGAVDSCETEDVPARTNIMGGVLAAVIAKMADAAFAKEWTMLDNSVQSFDADQMIAVGLAVMEHVNAAHDRARVLRAAVTAAESVAELLSIDIASGWPSL